MLKWFNIYELDYVLIHVVISIVHLQRDSTHTLFWLAVIFDSFFHAT